MTANRALNDSNSSSWNDNMCAELLQIFLEKYSLANIFETKNATLAEVITNKTCTLFNVSFQKNVSTEDIINHVNCSRDNVARIFQDCMVEELAQYTDCEGMDGGLVPLNEFNYSNAFMGCVIRYHLQQTDFVGMSVNSLSAKIYMCYKNIHLAGSCAIYSQWNISLHKSVAVTGKRR